MKIIRKFQLLLARAVRVPLNHVDVYIVSLYTLVWGIFVALPFWDVFSEANRYSALAVIAPEFVWGLIAITVGIVMLVGTYKNSVVNVCRAAYAGAVHWGLLSMAYFLGSWQDTGGITALFISILCAHVYLSLRVTDECSNPIDRDNLHHKKKTDNI